MVPVSFASRFERLEYFRAAKLASLYPRFAPVESTMILVLRMLRNPIAVTIVSVDIVIWMMPGLLGRYHPDTSFSPHPVAFLTDQ